MRLNSRYKSFSSLRCLWLFVLCTACSLPFPPPASAQNAASSAGSGGDDWPYYGHDAGGMRYSPLAQINRGDVAQLKVAWVYHTADVSPDTDDTVRSGLETTPILVDG